MNVTDRLAVCSWSLQPKSCDDLIEKLRACGITRTQLHLDPIAESAPGWETAVSRLQDAGITAVSGMVMCVGEDYSTIESIERTGGVVPDVTWPVTRERMRACAPVAGQLGLGLVTFHAGFIPHSGGELRDRIRGRITEIADWFAEQDCEVALETGQESADALLDFLGDVDRRDVGVNFDPANMLLYGSGDPIDALAKLLGHIKQVHLKDANRSARAGEWGAEVPVGEGEVDWNAFFSLLDKAGYRGNLPIEREAGGDRIGDIRKGVDYLRSL